MHQLFQHVSHINQSNSVDIFFVETRATQMRLIIFTGQVCTDSRFRCGTKPRREARRERTCRFGGQEVYRSRHRSGYLNRAIESESRQSFNGRLCMGGTERFPAPHEYARRVPRVQTEIFTSRRKSYRVRYSMSDCCRENNDDDDDDWSRRRFLTMSKTLTRAYSLFTRGHKARATPCPAYAVMSDNRMIPRILSALIVSFLRCKVGYFFSR